MLLQLPVTRAPSRKEHTIEHSMKNDLTAQLLLQKTNYLDYDIKMTV